MLARTGNIVTLHKDWSPARIGSAIQPALPRQGEGGDAIQAALLAKPQAPLPEPVFVPVTDQVERLANFIGKPKPRFLSR
jgi:hypothetical protein